jgi:glycine cleavage system H protein
MAYPTNYRYTREHEWISVEGNIGSIGITDYAQNSLGTWIIKVELADPGDVAGLLDAAAYEAFVAEETK